MAEYTFYCKIEHNKSATMYIDPGVYSFTTPGGYHRNPNLIAVSTKVWRQGPKGGVKITKDRTHWFGKQQYVTKDEKEMREFMWAKLRAQPYKKGA